MMSNLANQLKEQNALDRIQEVFAEIPRVRADLGYPPLVTPTSQIVGTQAVLNVIAGERYKTITNEVKRYLAGGYGQAPAPVDSELQKKAIGNNPVMENRPADELGNEMDRLRADIGTLATCDEDILTFAMFPDIGRQFLQERASGALQPEVLLPQDNRQSLAKEGVPTEFNIDVHGEQHEVSIIGVGAAAAGRRRVFMVINGVPEEVVFEPLNSFSPDTGQGKRPKAHKPGDVSAAMPGNVVDVLVSVGQSVNAGSALLVMEAMKMETEIQSSMAGVVRAIHVAKGDRVTPGEILLEID
jgi:pyruvate carboxylase subunit B